MRSIIRLQLRTHDSIKEHHYMKHHLLNQKLKSPNRRNFSTSNSLLHCDTGKKTETTFAIFIHSTSQTDLIPSVSMVKHTQSQYGTYRTGALQLKTLKLKHPDGLLKVKKFGKEQEVLSSLLF